MSKRLITLLTALLVLGFVVAGCGDDESDSSGNGDTAAETDTVTDETETVEGGGAAAPTSRAEAVENCERGVNAAKQLSDDAKEQLTEICEKAASGDPEDVREAARKVCETIVEDTFPENKSARDAALASCKSGSQ